MCRSPAELHRYGPLSEINPRAAGFSTLVHECDSACSIWLSSLLLISYKIRDNWHIGSHKPKDICLARTILSSETGEWDGYAQLYGPRDFGLPPIHLYRYLLVLMVRTAWTELSCPNANAVLYAKHSVWRDAVWFERASGAGTHSSASLPSH